ncbi:hypothetical protein TAMA11512_16930 [Selenomonas sp. TAMA-11512]|uniref:hypothetical protein n=1 Tax=Selenomonas sp. TAMA-11512 TaxID=3095337 RepID=UPI00308868B3|nr:hypothetical protein TAMA11512_16930 [Selenomonas sp. TAMA-11512]
MTYRVRKKIIGAALAALILAVQAPAAALPVTPDTEAQLDVMAASGVIEKELKTLAREEADLRRKGQAERTSYVFFAAVTDLDADGRLELLISRQLLSHDPLVRAGAGISENVRDGLNYISKIYPSKFDGAVYEISADKTKLEPRRVAYHGKLGFPDLSRIHVKGHPADGARVYHMNTQRIIQKKRLADYGNAYELEREIESASLDRDVLTVSPDIVCKGTIGFWRNSVEPYLTSMRVLTTGMEYKPYSAEARQLEKDRNAGRRVKYISWEELKKDTRAALSSSLYDWTYEDR